MTSYVVSDFSFNIGGTNINQRYVQSLRSGIPWGINSSYIYKEDYLGEQFTSNNTTNQHLVIENKSVNGNIIFKTQETGRIIINDLSVNSINGVPYSGIGSGIGSVGLTLNSVNSSHIQNGSILGSDICDGTITSEQLQANCVTETKIFDGAVTQSKLSIALLNRIAELEKLQGIISIRNSTSFAQGFSYTLSYKHPTTGALTQFASYTNLNYTLTASHFFKLPSPLHLITLKVDPSVSLEGYNVYYGAEDNLTGDGNNQDFLITDVNVLIGCEVAT
jgi:hypothetical protein